MWIDSRMSQDFDLCFTEVYVLQIYADSTQSQSKFRQYFLVEISKLILGFPGGSDGKESACNVGDVGLIPGLGRSSGEGNGSPLQYSCF